MGVVLWAFRDAPGQVTPYTLRARPAQTPVSAWLIAWPSVGHDGTLGPRVRVLLRPCPNLSMSPTLAVAIEQCTASARPFPPPDPRLLEDRSRTATAPWTATTPSVTGPVTGTVALRMVTSAELRVRRGVTERETPRCS